MSFYYLLLEFSSSITVLYIIEQINSVVVMSSGTFEVRVQKNGSWTCHKECRNEQEALALAHQLCDNGSFDAVKVVKEQFDEKSGLFRDKIIFTNFQQQGGRPATAAAANTGKTLTSAKTARGAPAGQSAAGMSAAHELPQTTQKWESKSVLIMAGLAFLLVANVGFAILFADRLGLTGSDGGANAQAGRVYDLPAVTTNFMTADGEKIIYIRLGFKIENAEREKTIDERLTDIVTGVLADLNRMKTDGPAEELDIEILKKRLKKTVKSISNEDIDEIMVKEIMVL